MSNPPGLSRQPLWCYLLTGPHTTQVPGLFAIGQAALAEALGWPASAVRARFAELQRAGMARADWDARVIWLPNAIRHNPPDNPNVVTGWRRALEMVPECNLKREALAALGVALQPFGERLMKPFCEVLDEPSPIRCPKQEQDRNRSRNSGRG